MRSVCTQRLRHITEFQPFVCVNVHKHHNFLLQPLITELNMPSKRFYPNGKTPEKDAGFQAGFSHLKDMGGLASGLQRPNLIIASMYGWFDCRNTFK